MTVYVLCAGSYEQRDVLGVYSSLANAMNTLPKYRWEPRTFADGSVEWASGDFDGADVTVFELDAELPL